MGLDTCGKNQGVQDVALFFSLSLSLFIFIFFAGGKDGMTESTNMTGLPYI